MAPYSAEEWGGSTSLDLLAIFCQLKIPLAALLQGTLLTRIHLGDHWVPRSFSANCSPAGWLPACTDAWNYSSPSAGLYTFSLFTFIWLLSAHLFSVSRSLWMAALSCVSHSSQFCIVTKLAKGTCCPFIQFINENVE